MRKYDHHKYTWTNRFTSVRHNWELVGPIGAINFHVSIMEDGSYEPSAGLEYHHLSGEGAPNHVDCPLTGSRCWHDGTSLFASETVWPFVKNYLKSGNHKLIFTYLELLADEHFEGGRN